MNGEMNTGGGLWTLAGGDIPIFKRSLLPTKPSGPGLYDILNGFMGAVKDAYRLGVAPPQGPTAEDVLKWKAQVSPWAEQQILNKTLGLKAPGNTVGI